MIAFTVNFILYNILNSLRMYLTRILLSFNFNLLSERMEESTRCHFLFFFLLIETKSDFQI